MKGSTGLSMIARQGYTHLSTHLEDLEEVEEPLLEIVFESKDEKVSVRQVGMGEKRLIGKVPGRKCQHVRLRHPIQNHSPQFPTFLSTSSRPPIGERFDHGDLLILVSSATNGTILLESHHPT